VPSPDDAFQYAIWRVVPSVERGEALNVGVVVYCRRRQFLAARVLVDEARLHALSPDLDVTAIGRHLDGMVRVAAGDAAGGAIAAMPQSERFGWLTAASSTIVQPSPIHTGLCGDPQAVLDRLYTRLVAATRPA
jgi:DNA-directed RNA polymerase subunit N (RpoN/RPB10)